MKLGEYQNVLRGNDRRSEKAVRVREPQRSLHFWDLIGIQSDFSKEFCCLLFAFSCPLKIPSFSQCYDYELKV